MGRFAMDKHTLTGHNGLMVMRRKIGRNEPCPCGSGVKYKQCHGGRVVLGSTVPNASDESDVKSKLQELQAMELQRVKQQGQGRRIISCVHKGHRYVAVGDKYYCSRYWITFHDFLFDYVKLLFGEEWVSDELRRGSGNRHPILQWYELTCKKQAGVFLEPGVPHAAPMSGAAFAYLLLSYNLYLLAHNIKVRSLLVERLKDKGSFFGAFYETIVASSFIKAGFTLELEREDDYLRTHCEFTAISPKTQKAYSIEAKARMPGKSGTSVRTQLHKALTKEADHARVIFIDLSVPTNITTSSPRAIWLDSVLGELRSCENTLTVHRRPAPEAYVFVTNHPFLYNLDSYEFAPAVVLEGFKISDLKLGAAPLDLEQALGWRDKYVDMLDVIQAMKEYEQIPSTWDGGIPEFVYGQTKLPRLRIGGRYVIPDESGIEVTGELEDGCILEDDKTAYGIYKLDDGRKIIATCPVTEEELAVYRKYPDTFFGVERRTPRTEGDAIDMFDLCYSVYVRTPREKLLEFLRTHPHFEELQNLSQEELARIYCKGIVYSMMQSDQARS
jgi:hypothetical protein